jgi:hypothetical protein
VLGSGRNGAASDGVTDAGANLISMAEDDLRDERTLQVAATAGSAMEANLICQRLAEAGIQTVSQRSIGGPA